MPARTGRMEGARPEVQVLSWFQELRSRQGNRWAIMRQLRRKKLAAATSAAANALEERATWGSWKAPIAYLITRALAVAVSRFCTPPFKNNPETVSGTAVPAGILLSSSALSKLAVNVLPSDDTETATA